MKRSDGAACIANGLLHKIDLGVWFVALLLQVTVLYKSA